MRSTSFQPGESINVSFSHPPWELGSLCVCVCVCVCVCACVCVRSCVSARSVDVLFVLTCGSRTTTLAPKATPPGARELLLDFYVCVFSIPSTYVAGALHRIWVSPWFRCL